MRSEPVPGSSWSFSNVVLHSPPPPVRTPGVVALEDRTLLAAGPGTFAHFNGTLAGPHAHATIPITISPADFNLASGHVLLGLDMQTPGSAADRRRTAVPRCGPWRIATASGYSLVELGAGTYTLQITANGRAGQSYSVAVSLAGATSGGFQVDPQDLATIRSLEGQRRGAPGYLAAADVNHDGRIGPVDLRLARLNLGAATRIRPLSVTLGLDPSTPTTAGGAVYQPTVSVVGQTARRGFASRLRAIQQYRHGHDACRATTSSR